MTHAVKSWEWPHNLSAPAPFRSCDIQANWRIVLEEIPNYLQSRKAVPFHALTDDVLAQHPCFDPMKIPETKFYDDIGVS